MYHHAGCMYTLNRCGWEITQTWKCLLCKQEDPSSSSEHPPHTHTHVCMLVFVFVFNKGWVLWLLCNPSVRVAEGSLKLVGLLASLDYLVSSRSMRDTIFFFFKVYTHTPPPPPHHIHTPHTHTHKSWRDSSN